MEKSIHDTMSEWGKKGGDKLKASRGSDYYKQINALSHASKKKKKEAGDNSLDKS